MSVLQNLDLKLCSTVTIWPKGQIVIPKEVRETMNLNQWDSLVLFLKSGKFIWLLRNDDLDEITNFIEAQLNNFKKLNK
jgi:AbrB family looped-hinge helix DNA binding protein